MKKKEEGTGYYYFLGRVLFRERKRLGWSQEYAAKKIGRHASDLSRIENGKKPLAEDLLLEICRLYRIQVDEVTGNAHDQYQAHLREREPRRNEPVEQYLPNHPFSLRVVELYDRYTQLQQEKERDEHEKARELFLALLHYMEMLKTTL